MTQVVGKTGATSIFYGVYLRVAAEYTRPTDLAGVETLLGTGEEVGYHEKDSIISKVEPNDTVEAQKAGSVVEVPQDYVGTFEAKNINGSEANLQSAYDTYLGKDVDIILYDPKSERMQVILDVPAIFTEETGSKASLAIRVKKIINDPASFRDRFSFSDFTAGT